MRKIGADLRRLSRSGSVRPQKLRQLSVDFDLLLDRYIFPFHRNIPSRMFADSWALGSVPIVAADEEFFNHTQGIIRDWVTFWMDVARGIREGDEDGVAEHYGFSRRDLAKIKAQLKDKGWLL